MNETKPTFTPAQEIALDYIVLCSVNQGVAHANGKDAEQAVEITLEEDKLLKSHQLAHPDPLVAERMHIGKRMRQEAVRRVTEQWSPDEPMKYRGKIFCKACRTLLNQSAEPVLEREKAWCERQAIYMAKPNCEHAKAANGIFTDIEVEWFPWEAQVPEPTNSAKL